MFYAHFVLAKKGPLARIWLAAHWDKKLTKAHVFETNIESSVEGILAPKVKLALRTSGHLLLGIVRIYSRKAKYLLADCNEAFIKIKMAFRPGVVDLPEGNREAAVATITLPEVFHDFDTAMPDITIDMDAQVTLNQSRAEDITLKEDYGTLSLMTDDGFGDMGFDDPEVARDATNIDEGFDHTSLLLCDDRSKEKLDDQGPSGTSMSAKSLDTNLKDDGFDGPVVDLLDPDAGGLFEPSGLFDDAPLSHVGLENNSDQVDDNRQSMSKPLDAPLDDSDDDDMYDMGPASMGAPSPPSSPPTPPQATEHDSADPIVKDLHAQSPDGLLGNNLGDPSIGLDPLGEKISTETDNEAINEMPPPPAPKIAPPPPLIPNEEESFALAPLDATIMQGAERAVKTKRKRKLIVDEVKNISGEEMKAQLSDTTDIVTTLDLAPPTKRLMHYKETGGVEKLFALPGHPILSKTLSRMYQRHLTTRSVDNEDFDLEDDRVDHIDLDKDLDHFKDEEIARKRRREMDVIPADQVHLEVPRHSFPSDANLSQHPMEVPPNFMPQHMYQALPDSLQQPMMMSTPHSSHMMQQMLSPDIHQLSHISTMMHSTTLGVDEAHQLHTLTPTIQDIVPDNFTASSAAAEPIVSNLLSDPMASLSNTIVGASPDKVLGQSSIDVPNFEDQLDHSVDHVERDILQNCVNGQILEAHADDPTLATVDSDNTQPQQPVISDEHLPSPSLDGQGFLSHVNDSQNSELPTSSMPYSTITENLNGDKRPDIPDGNEEENIVRNSGDDLNPNDKLFDAQPSDDEDDFGAPGSVGPMYADEQMADETYEQFEERILTKRTTHMLHIINNQLDEQEYVKFSDLIRNNKRKQVAQKFYTFLVLKKQQAVELRQDKPYGELLISRGPKFDAVYNAN